MGSVSSSDGKDLHGGVSPRQTVLVVDEDFKDARQYCALLRTKGYEVQCRCSYAEGEACLKDQQVGFVIVNQGSRAFEGRRIVKHAVRKNAKAPVLVLTRDADMSCYIEAMSLGASDYLQKPVSPEEILQQVAKYTGDRT
jgi:two-component system phosphoglycerate transport system response regulator PgtA